METVSTVVSHQVFGEGFGIIRAGSCPEIVKTAGGRNFLFFQDAERKTIIVTMKQWQERSKGLIDLFALYVSIFT